MSCVALMTTQMWLIWPSGDPQFDLPAVHNLKIHSGWCYMTLSFLLMLIFAGFPFHTSPTLSPYPLNIRFWGLHILFLWYVLPEKRTKNFWVYNLVMLIQLTLLAILSFSWLIQWKSSCTDLYSFNILFTPGLLFWLIIRDPTNDCKWTVGLWIVSTWFCLSIPLSVFRRNRKLTKIDFLLRLLCLSYRPSVNSLGRTGISWAIFHKILYFKN